jgi:hypothetical protein
MLFVDDELIARTSADGRLKIPNLKAGQHKLRVSLDGYRDYEKGIDLVAGVTLELSAVLESNTQPAPRAAASYIPGAANANAPPGAATDNLLTLPGSIGFAIGRMIGPNYPGTITVGNGILRFSANEPFGKYSFEVPISNVALRNQYKSGVEFDVQFSNKKQHCGFWVYFGKHREDDNVAAAKKLFEALKAGAR